MYKIYYRGTSFEEKTKVVKDLWKVITFLETAVVEEITVTRIELIADK